MTIAAFLENLIVDNTIHAWDLGTAAGIDVELDDALVANAERWVEANDEHIRRPGFFGPALTPSPAADAQTAVLAALGR